jgi:hypothetical protein
MKHTMRRAGWLGGAVLAVSSTLALAAPESLLPPIFDEPAPAPTPAPAPRPTAAAPAPTETSGPVVQPLPDAAPGTAGDDGTAAISLEDFPSLEEIEAMDPDDIDELFGLKPKYDIPPGAQRALRRVGVIGSGEGGFPSRSLAGQPASLVRAALAGTRRPLVSRWGHILLRRALASRLDAPEGMNPVQFAALRAALLNRIGEGATARALVQDVDSANYNAALAAAAFDAYLATGDIVGICPVAQLKSDLHEGDPQWQMTRSICDAFDGNARSANRQLDRALSRGIAPRIDVLLAQRFAGAAGEGRRAVTIEWDGVEELTPWRLALSRALGVEVPDELRSDMSDALRRSDALYPAAPIPQRAAAADLAARYGVLSSAALVDLYSQLWSDPEIDDSEKGDAGQLREAYVARSPEERLEAIRSLWGGSEPDYGRQVLTAYAAARLPVSEDLADDAVPIIASMLAAGLDRNAMRWADVVDAGSEGWALLALAQPRRQGAVSSGAVDSFLDDDASPDQRKSRFLVAGLAGLGRLDSGNANSFANRLGIDLERETKWSQAIGRAGEYRNPALVALLAGLGMQGSGWDKMTARHLFHIVRALDRAGLNAEARMIAAEAVARG